MDCSPPGSSVHGILQARILEWVAMLSSRRSSQSRDWAHVSFCLLHWQVASWPSVPPGKPFRISKWYKIIFQSAHVSWHSCRQCLSMPIAPHPHHTVSSLYNDFKMLAGLLGVQWYFIEVQFCISLVLIEVKHLSICFFSHLYIFLRWMFIQVICPSFNWVICLFVVEHKSSLHSMDTRSLTDIWFVNIFSLSVGFFLFHIVSLKA